MTFDVWFWFGMSGAFVVIAIWLCVKPSRNRTPGDTS